MNNKTLSINFESFAGACVHEFLNVSFRETVRFVWLIYIFARDFRSNLFIQILWLLFSQHLADLGDQRDVVVFGRGRGTFSEGGVAPARVKVKVKSIGSISG